MADRWDEEAQGIVLSWAEHGPMTGGRLQILIASALRRAAGEWLPIETYAGSGPPVDVWLSYPKSGEGRRVSDAFVDLDTGDWLDDDGEPIEWGPDEYGQSAVVTHYRPLPAPPESDHD